MIEEDQQTNKESQERIRRWTNTHQLIKLVSIWWKDEQIVVAGDNNLKRGVIHFFHDTPLAGHPGIGNTYELAKRDVWWPNMKQDIEQYVKGCTACQANKANTRPLKPAMIPIAPEHSLPFQTVAMDFITKLPLSGGFDMILTITDHDCTKAAILIPCNESITAEGVAALWLRYVFPRFGIPRKIISDHDTRFTSKFARALCNALEIKQNVSTAYHPRTDGQSERTNQTTEVYLRIYCDKKQNDWHKWLSIAEFAHNKMPNATTKKSPYDMIMGFTPKLDWQSTPSPVPGVTARLKQLEEIRNEAFENLIKAQKMMAMKHPGNRRFSPYKEGDQA